MIELQASQSAQGPYVETLRRLLRTNLLLEQLLSGLRLHPWLLVILPWWILRGRDHLHARAASFGAVNVKVLPYDEGRLVDLQQAQAAGRPVWLIIDSPAQRAAANAIGDHLGVQGVVMSSEVESRGVSAPSLVGQATRAPGRESPKVWMNAMRLHQWAKNLLILLPVITAHRFLDVRTMLDALMAFFAIGLCASGTYVMNDLLDLDADRQHRTKRNRPFAAGRLPLGSGCVMAALLVAAGLLLATTLTPGFVGAIVIYLVTTALYSFWFKRVASLDIVVLAGLYVLRVLAGAWATGITLSFWLLAFSMFIFLCLALAKRVAELVDYERALADHEGNGRKLRGRSYGLHDIQILQIMGGTSGYVAVLVLALYVHSPEVAQLYATPELLWLLVPILLLWVTRLWLITTRGQMHEDPVVFAVKDPETWLTIAASAGVMMLAVFPLFGS